MANGHGGARPGAGRPSKAQLYADDIRATEQAIVDRLAEVVAVQLAAATDNIVVIDEVYEPAGMLTIQRTVIGPSGEVRATEPAFPNLDPEQLVLVRRTRRVSGPDLRTGQYLINRIAGTPTQKLEADLDTPTDGVLAQFLGAVAKAYGGPDSDEPPVLNA
jgi:hypothetical protein